MAYVVWGGVTYAMGWAEAALLFIGAVSLAWLIAIGLAIEAPCFDPSGNSSENEDMPLCLPQ